MASFALTILVPLISVVLKVESQSRELALLAYPKCGRTWLTMMLKTVLRGAGAQIDWVNSHGEGVHGHPYLSTAAELEARFAAFAAAGSNVSAYFKDAQKTILLLRDPLDVLVSSFHDRKHRGRFNAIGQKGYELPMNASLGEYARELRGGLSSYVAFLNSWVPAALSVPDHVLVVHYEALVQCPMHVISHIVNGFLGMNVSCAVLRKAVATNTFQRLQDSSRHSWDPYLAPHDAANPDSAKFRKGRAHAAHEELSSEAYAVARRTLNALSPVVREAFYEGTRLCYVLGSENSVEATGKLRTQDLTCWV